MAARAILRGCVFVPVLLILVGTLYSSTHAVNVGTISVNGDSIRSILGTQRRTQIPNCCEMVSKSQCSQNSKCRWCRSEALDDMCFSKSEAWRLPSQCVSAVLTLIYLCYPKTENENSQMEGSTTEQIDSY